MGVTITRKSIQKQCLKKTAKRRKSNADQVAIKTAAAGLLPNDLVPDIELSWREVEGLKALKRRVRKADAQQVARAVLAIKNFTFISPITVRGKVVVDGYSRLAAAKELGLTKVPCIDVSHLSEPQARMLAISLNRLAETGSWDLPELKIEMLELELAGLDLELSNFSPQELDIIMLDDVRDSSGEEDYVPSEPAEPVSRLGDLWRLGEHRIYCADALAGASYERLLGDITVTGVLTDAPYNVKITGNVSGLGKTKHADFKMASGELSATQFGEFLTAVHQHCADHLIEGGVVYSFMDWRSIDTLMAAGREAGLTLINMVVWYKGSGAMGAFLRSAHELLCVFCKGDKPKIRNIELGKHGRDRANVWVYPGANRPGTAAADALKDHPTPKNLQMCIDALLDISLKGNGVLDPFLGSGTTLIAAEKSGRICYGLELSPAFVDVCVRRWEATTGKQAVLDHSGLTFREVAAQRAEV